jgi:seryl-tRNA synthetase
VIDIKLLREDPDLVRRSQQARGEDPGLVDAILAADETRRRALAGFESARAEQKAFGKQVAAAKGADKAALVEQVKTLAERVKALDAEVGNADQWLGALMRRVGNVIHDEVPAGDEDHYIVREVVGTPRDFAGEGFAPLDHLQLGELHDAIDIERGARVSGSRFYYLKGIGVRLERAVMGLGQLIAYEEGFVPLGVPNLVKAPTMAGAGFLDVHADEVYHLPADDLYLTGTSEVGLAGYHLGEILDLEGGPLSYTATTTCYRREAGSHGKDTRGIFRTHQFQKTEMFVFCRPEDAEAEHDRLLRIERRILDAVEIPYRIIDVAAGDLGGPAARKFDCEGWVPSQSRYRELTSTSNCTTFQARRLGVRERGPDGGTRFVATLNGTMATTRWLVAILENHQQRDGSITVPDALRPYLGLDVLEPA